MPDCEEWEPNLALQETLKRISLQPEADSEEALTELIPHVEQALAALDLLERQRSLSARERIIEEAFRMLLVSIQRVK